MRPNFKDIDIKNAGFAAQNAAEWAKANGIEANWKTPEQIEVKPVYTKEDLEGIARRVFDEKRRGNRRGSGGARRHFARLDQLG